MVTLCMDRPVHEDGEVVGHWQTVDWLIGLRELAEESHSIALSSLPPSDMRMVPVERLRQIEWAGEDGSCPACNGLAPGNEAYAPAGDLPDEAYMGHAPDCWLGNAIRENRV